MTLQHGRAPAICHFSTPQYQTEETCREGWCGSVFSATGRNKQGWALWCKATCRCILCYVEVSNKLFFFHCTLQMDFLDLMCLFNTWNNTFRPTPICFRAEVCIKTHCFWKCCERPILLPLLHLTPLPPHTSLSIFLLRKQWWLGMMGEQEFTINKPPKWPASLSKKHIYAS